MGPQGRQLLSCSPLLKLLLPLSPQVVPCSQLTSPVFLCLKNLQCLLRAGPLGTCSLSSSSRGKRKKQTCIHQSNMQGQACARCWGYLGQQDKDLPCGSHILEEETIINRQTNVKM